MTSGDHEPFCLVVTHIEEDGCTFSAQKHSSTSDSDLKDIASSLQSHAQSGGKKIDKFAKNLLTLKGQVFAAQYVDGAWYRCRLLFATGDGKCLVQFIDYGNCEEKSISSLMDIPANVTESVIPGMAGRYRLDGVVANTSNTDDINGTVRFMETVCFDVILKAEIVSNGKAEGSSPCRVILYDENGTSVGDRLLDLGFVIKESELKTKTDVLLSSPPVPQAQLFRNPLLSSPIQITRQTPTVSSLTAQVPGLDVAFSQSVVEKQTECGYCDKSKEFAEKMRLHVMRLNLKLEESEKVIDDLKKSEQHWKKLYSNIQRDIGNFATVEKGASEIQKCNEESMTDCCGVELVESSGRRNVNTGTSASVIANSLQHESAESQYTTLTAYHRKNMDLLQNYSPSNTSDNQADHLKNFKPQRQVSNDQNDACAPEMKKDDALLPVEKISDFMKKTIMPAFSYFKTMVNFNTIMESCSTYEAEMKDVVSKIKSCLDIDQNCKRADQSGFATRRNTVIENLKQSLQHAVQILVKDTDAMKEIVAGHVEALRELHARFGSREKSVNNAALLVSEVETYIKKVETKNDVSVVSKMMFDGLRQQLDKFIPYKDRKCQFQQLLDDISTYEGHERTIKELTNENRCIRKRKQGIRLLVTEIQNLKEQFQDATPSELEDLKVRIRASGDKLSNERHQIQENFESRWYLMETLADVVEKFYPELQIEYKELGLSDYIKGEGIVMKDMEMDHFDIGEDEPREQMGAVVYSTEYRSDKISLHRYGNRRMPLHAILKRIAMYSNVESEHALLPTGVFTSMESVFLMVTKPPVVAVPIDETGELGIDTVEVVLRDIATALYSLHQSGLTHGMISKRSIMYAGDIARAYLSVPNFFCSKDSSQQTLANDVVQYGNLAQDLMQNKCNPKIEQVISTCMNNSNSITMKNVLDYF